MVEAMQARARGMSPAAPESEATAAAVTVEPVAIAAPGAELAGQLYRPRRRPAAAVVLNGATGVPQAYYRHFATWLAAERGLACLTYDYRDFGASARGGLRDSRASMRDWAMLDQPAARAEMRRRLPGVPLWVIGHSLGGMMVPLQTGISDIRRMIAVASGLVHHRDHPWPYQALARLFWFGHVPLLVRALGYLPGRAVGFGADLPAQVYWDWRRWCTSPQSYLPETGAGLPRPDWGRSGAPVDLIGLADDPVIPSVSVARLAPVYRGGALRRHLLAPGEFGLRSVGHLGAFARANRALWPAILDPGPGLDAPSTATA